MGGHHLVLEEDLRLDLKVGNRSGRTH